MRTFSVRMVKVGALPEWVVIATNDDGSEDWLVRCTTAAEAREVAVSLAEVERSGGEQG
jgi:hypothetical protein